MIHLDHLIHNLNTIREAVGEKVALCPAVKADAYGHGLLEVSRALKKEKVPYLSVSSPSEALELRRGGIRGPILCLGLTRGLDLDLALDAQGEVTVCDQRGIQELGEKSRLKGQITPVHLKVDVGMGRLGCLPGEAQELAQMIGNHPQLRLAGIYTHFPCSDNGQSEPTKGQNSLFRSIVQEIQSLGLDTGMIHAANSGAIFDAPDSHWDMVRPGIALYGYLPSQDMQSSPPLKPVMEFQTQLSLVKKVPKGHTISYGSTYTTTEDTWIAVVPVGYGDGYPRLLSGKAPLKVGEKTYQIAGRVCMDQFMVDLGPESWEDLQAPVVLFGPQGPGAHELAQIIGTISYEILTGITSRVPRIYLNT